MAMALMVKTFVQLHRHLSTRSKTTVQKKEKHINELKRRQRKVIFNFNIKLSLLL